MKAGSLLQWYQGPFKRWLALGIVLVCLLPVFVWEVLFPRPFDTTAHSDVADYAFRDPDHAVEFAALNLSVAGEEKSTAPSAPPSSGGV